MDSQGTAPYKAVVIVAHPDDESLWAGGAILSHPQWTWHIASLCRASDPDRAPKFHRVSARMGASGSMADLDDGPDQHPLGDAVVRQAILAAVPPAKYDLIVTHGPRGEYTRHRRHEETCRAVVGLWADGLLSTRALWMFAFEDGGGAYLPLPQAEAPERVTLDDETWASKYSLITEGYGFAPNSWEARATPRSEAFWRFGDADSARRWVENQ